MTLPACAGGWCKKREQCADYHAVHRTSIVERLCPKGQDEPEYPGVMRRQLRPGSVEVTKIRLSKKARGLAEVRGIWAPKDQHEMIKASKAKENAVKPS
jgi:hypothetical protein